MPVIRALAIALAGIGIAMLLSAGTGTRIGLWDFRFGLTLLRYSAYVAIAAMMFSVLALLITRERGRTPWSLLLALVLSAITFVVPWNFSRTARSVPPIHDITTDTADPPRFVALLPERTNAPNGFLYAGDSIAALQAAAYPDVQPVLLDMTTEQAFERALAAAHMMGWEVVDEAPAQGRIEATATTRWFGFKDDVVIRIRRDNTGSVVDVRSMSRIGRSDVGANAARIQKFMSRLQEL